MFEKSKAIWITWECQRRSEEMARALDVKYYPLADFRKGHFEHLSLCLKTIGIIFHLRPHWVFVQNPSNVLAALICFLRSFFHFKVIVDRHSNFFFSIQDTKQYSKLHIFISNQLSAYSIKKGNLTIVTNEYIKRLVEKGGGKGFVLQDKIPSLSKGKFNQLKGKYNVVFPCTFSPDEPTDEVIKAAEFLDQDIYIYITGRYESHIKLSEVNIPANVILTGFLSEDDYRGLLFSADLVLGLTTRDHTLLCCAYEAVTLSKPLILSDKAELIDYFFQGRVTTPNHAQDIAAAIRTAVDKVDKLRAEVVEMRRVLTERWTQRFAELIRILDGL